MLLAEHRQRFKTYSAPFLQGAPDVMECYRLKIDHTYNVLANAEAIVKTETNDQTLSLAASLAALYHDIGRFRQLEQYKTFNDRESENHAKLGARILRQTGLIDDLGPELRRLVMAGVGLHNVAALPKNIPDDLGFVCGVVRDSDKLDILRNMVEHLENPNEVNEILTLGAPAHPTNYTQKIFDDISSGRTCSYADIHWANDFKLVMAAWVFDMNSRTSSRLLRKTGLIKRIFRTLPDNEIFRALRERVLRQLDDNCSN